MSLKRQWLTAYTKPSGELRAKAFLEGKGIEVYLPVIAKTISHAGRSEVKPRPVFPRYIFFKNAERIGDVKNTPGISNVVKFGEEYVVAPSTVIEGLRALENDEGYVELPPSPVSLWTPRVGQRVRIKSGTFEGKYAVYSGMAGESRVSVLISILRRSIKVDLEKDDIEDGANQ